MSRVTPLFELQQVDSNIDRHNINIANIETTLLDKTTLEAARQAVSDVETLLRNTRTKLKDLEFETQTVEKHASDLEKKLYEGLIKGVKEMKAAQSEIDTFRKRRAELEDSSVEAMLEVEEVEKSLEVVRQKLATVENEREKSLIPLTQELTKLKKELGELQLAREKQVRKITPSDLPLYEKLRSQKQGVAVAELLMGKICGKCRVDIPLSKQRDLKSPIVIITCPSCGRILYLP
ncbi:MAG: hypothetical protein HXX08_06820 [Chloroflexi bacterium]|uniref:CT398-like coiled coil hairpin domain-containing protein n=1 Tax=Candidatus Chlorohelix allophototropha TaxID=3003348 RepID=A0A8T7LX81_9CHLR|nr:hypothetical protein [Chloroflexota bacterium]WJW67446.1 hypothetical protein OZ401_000712 [Chloroflexota bacterium L227-S17]